MAYKADINIAVKGTRDLNLLSKKLEASATQIDKVQKKLVKWADVTKDSVVPSLLNLNNALGEATENFNKSVLGTNAAINAARNLVTAERAVNKELAERTKLLNSIRGVNPSQYSQPAGPKLLAGQTSSIAKDGTGTLVGQRMSSIGGVAVEDRIKTILSEQETLQQSLLGLERRATSELEKKAALRAKNKQEFRSEVEALVRGRNAEKAAMKAEVEATKSIVAEEIKRKQAGKLTGLQRRKNMEMANREVLLEMKLTKLAQRRARGKQFRGAVGSGLIGGAFPLLFGQGLGASVGGAAGGFGGGMMGGQFGFALSLVGTAIGSAIDRFVDGAAKLGQAMGPFKQDTTAITQALGLQNSVQEARLNLIEQTKGKTAAFNAAMKIMALEVGDRGVQALQRFGESARLMGGAFALLGTRLQALAAGFGNFILQITGVKNALEKGEARQIVRFSALQGNTEAQGLIDRRESLSNVTGSRKRFLTDKTQQLNLDEKLFAIRQKIRTEADLLTSSTDALLKDKKEEVAANERIKELMSEGINKELAKELAGIEQKFSKTQEYLELKAVEAELAFRTAVTEGKSEEEIEKRRNALSEIAKILGENNTKLAEALGLTKSLNEESDFIKVKWEDIKETIASGLTSAVQGLIDGTKSLGESLAGIARSIGSMFLKAGFSNMLGSTGWFGAEGGYLSNGIRPFASGGMVTRPTMGLIGEAGEDEYIIPASKMAQSMQRYSAGARGESVIPGTGQSSSGGGANAQTTVNYSGPILNFNSEEFVPKSAVGQIINSAASKGAAAGEARTLTTLRNSRSARSRIGM